MEITDNTWVYPAPTFLFGLAMGPDTGSLQPCLLDMGKAPTCDPQPLSH